MQFDELKSLCDKHPFYLPVDVVAEFLHMKASGLRAAIDQGRCPFGFSWQLGDRAGYKIPTLAFVSWLTKGTMPMPTQ